LSADDRDDEASGLHRASPSGPRVPPRQPRRAATGIALPRGIFRPSLLSVIILMLVLLGLGIRAYREMSRPGTRDYPREAFREPSMRATVISNVDLDGSGRFRRALAIRGDIDWTSADWFDDQVEQARLSPDDLIVLSSDGGKLNQSMLMGETIRKRGFATAVGTADASGKVYASSCASACVFVYAGGKTRYGIFGSQLGVHRFTKSGPTSDPVAESQKTQGRLLGYIRKMGISSRFVELMSQTSEINWLDPRTAQEINLITVPLERH
jgi:hypothetical protein